MMVRLWSIRVRATVVAGIFKEKQGSIASSVGCFDRFCCVAKAAAYFACLPVLSYR